MQRELRAARHAVRRAGRAAQQLQRTGGRELGRYELAAGEPVNEREVLDFLRLALADTQEGVVIVVSQPAPGPDPEGET